MKYKKILSGVLALAITAGIAVTGTTARAENLTPTNASTGVGLTITLSIPCKVTFNANGHGTAPTEQQVAVGAKAAKPTDPTAEGFVFGGWFTTSDCTGTAFDFDTTLSAHTTLYAKWTEKTDQIVTPPTGATGLIYTEAAQQLLTSAASITTGNTTAGVQYSLDNSTWSADLPTGTNAGTYTIYYKVAGNDTYKDFVCASPVSVTIGKTDPTAPTGITAVEGQTLADVTLPAGWTWADSSSTSVGDVGSNKFKANYTDTTGNYNNAADVDVTVTVSPAVTYTYVPASSPGCTSTGNYEYYTGSDGKYYTKSGDTYTETTLAAVTRSSLGHNWGAWTTVTEPTCSKTGTEKHTCSRCGTTRTRTIAALSHVHGEPVRENVVDASCTEDGSYDEVVYCTVGGEEISRVKKTIEKLGHDYDPETHICSRCGGLDPAAVHTVTFDTDGADDDITARNINHGETAEKPADPTKTGYTFLGWYLGDEAFDFTQPITSAVTLTAKWQINKYTVTFDSQGGSKVNSQTVEYNGTASKPADPTRDGVTFKGWTLNGKAYDFAAPVTSDITLTADWDIEKFTVTFDPANGSDKFTSTVEIDKTVSEPETPVREGYNFLGWYNGDEEYNFAAKVTENVSLTAKWEIITFTVKFDSKGGNVIDPVTVNYGEKITLPTPEKEGFTFAGWKNGETAFDAETPVTSDLTLTAEWKAIEYDVKLYFNGVLYTTIPVEHGKKVDLPAIPVSEGNVFFGWTTDRELKVGFTAFTPITSNLELFSEERPASGILLDGNKESGTINDTLADLKDKTSEYKDYIIIYDDQEDLKKITFPKGDSSIVISGSNGKEENSAIVFNKAANFKPNQELTLSDITVKADKKGKPQNITLKAAKGKELLLDNVTFDGKKTTVKATKGNVTIGDINTEKAGVVTVKGSAKTTAEVDGTAEVDKISGFEKLTIKSGSTFTVTKTLSVNELDIQSGATLVIGNNASVTIKKNLSGNGTLRFEGSVKPAAINGTVSAGTMIRLEGDSLADNQLFTSKLTNLNEVFDVSAAVPSDDYALSTKSSKVTLSKCLFSVNGKKYSDWTDMMNEIAKSDGTVTVELISDANIGSAFKFPSKPKYSKIIINGSGKTLTFKGKSVTLTSDTTFTNIKVVSESGAWTVSKKGKTLDYSSAELVDVTEK